MKIVFTLIVLLHAILAVSQQKLDYGSIVSDSSFNCEEKWPNFPGVESICKSKNEFEIRLNAGSGRGPYQLVRLWYSAGNWNAEKFTSTRYGGDASLEEHLQYNIPPHDQPILGTGFKKVFDLLKANNVFTLSNFNATNYPDIIINDGAGFLVTFKIEDKFRSYAYYSPNNYLKQYPSDSTLKSYANISRLLLGLFK